MKVIKKAHIDILEMNEDITIKNSEHFRLMMGKFLTESTSFFILDLSRVSYLNSSGLGVIADGAMKASKNGKELVVAGINPPMNEIFEIVKFNTFMELFSSLELAEGYFEQKFTL
ncbi:MULTISPECIES: STAS domain-containing protein [Niallia]|uniref:STAS domain-containing protein n=1 Tax=Niallia TaxID=2837506 RepID=UPI001EDBD121|nr:MULTISPECIES: STAS domain-containing protein [Niallia]MED4037428.1 STAS domain-containing protein [Niallia taxi]UPO91090.1 STAS domain-containing protein [Niallia sp. Man26]